jgi:hypothetical protein
VIDDAEPLRRAQLKDHLTTLSAKLARELTVRGFDPAQSENIPMPPALAKLYIQVQTLRDEIQSLDESAAESNKIK